MEGALATASSLSAGYTSKWPFHLNSKHGDKPLDLRVTHFQTNPILNGGYHIYIYIVYIYIYLKDFFCFSAWSSFPCYLLHFGAKICVLHAFWSQNLPFACPLGFWLLAFGFWLHLASLGFAWLHLASLDLWLMAFGFGFTWLWFWPFTSLGSWRLLGFSIVVCIQHFMYYIAYIFHVNCTKTTDIEYRSLYACCCKEIAKPSIKKT